MQNLYPEEVIRCPACSYEKPPPETLQLACKHIFCLDCLSGEWESKIIDERFSPEQVKCLNKNCAVPIKFYELESVLKKEILKIYENYHLVSFQNFNGAPEKAILCPNEKCRAKLFVKNSLSYFCCHFCKNSYCVDCFGDWDLHVGIKCKEFKAKHMSKEQENQFYIKECPKCKMIVEKKDFSNLTRCPSTTCKKSTIVCLLCGGKLDNDRFLEHFKNENPCESSCVNFVEKLLKVPIIKERNIKCPQCGDQESLEFAENFPESILICHSVICKGKYVCLKCKNYFNDKNFNKHHKHADFDCTMEESDKCVLI